MGDERIKLSREELYQQVWSKPATKIAKELGISDVAIAKICKKLNIPKPYPGYWQQVEAGHSVQPPPLPKAQQGVQTEVVIQPSPVRRPSQPQNPEVLAKIEAERQINNQISIAYDLHNAHPLVSETKQILEKAEPDLYSLLRAPWRQSCLDVRVSKNTLHRALRIMDALLKALETRGYAIKVSKEASTPTQIIVRGQEVKVRLSEKPDRSERELTKEEKSKAFSAASDRWTYTPNGKLIFMIDEYWSDGARKRWPDKIQKPLEEQLNEIVAGIITAAEGLRQREIEVQKQRRKWEEQERHRQEEERRRQSLELQSELWLKTSKMRSFLQACESSIIKKSGAVAPDSPEARWLEWAYKYVDRLDPLTNGAFKNMIQQFAKNT